MNKLYAFFRGIATLTQMFRMKMFWLFTKDSKHPVATYATPIDISYGLKRGTRYKRDPSWRDPIFHPQWIERKLSLEKRIGDCDDHAIYWCAALIKSGLAKKVWFSGFGYMNAQNQFKGHAVCVFIGLDDKMYWADYTDPKLVTVDSNNIVPDGFEWVIQGVKDYGRKFRSARMIEITGLNKRETPRFGKVTYFKPERDLSADELREGKLSS